MRKVVFGLCFFALAGCLESEKSCYERLDEELESDIDFIQTAKSISYSDRLDIEIHLRGEQIRLLSLYNSENADVCDFYIDRFNLVRK